MFSFCSNSQYAGEKADKIINYREEPPLSAVSTQLSRVQAGGLQYHRELVGGGPALGILLAGRHHLTLQALGLARLVEGDHVDPQL